MHLVIDNLVGVVNWFLSVIFNEPLKLFRVRFPPSSFQLLRNISPHGSLYALQTGTVLLPLPASLTVHQLLLLADYPNLHVLI